MSIDLYVNLFVFNVIFLSVSFLQELHVHISSASVPVRQRSCPSSDSRSARQWLLRQVNPFLKGPVLVRLVRYGSQTWPTARQTTEEFRVGSIHDLFSICDERFTSH
jgi:hypothetical protein